MIALRLASSFLIGLSTLTIAACGDGNDEDGASDGTGGNAGFQAEPPEDLSGYDAQLTDAEVRCEPAHMDYKGDWFPNDNGEMSVSLTTGKIEWVEGDGTLTLIEEKQKTSANAGDENVLKFEITWKTPTEPGQSVRFSGRITGGEHGAFAVLCASGVARVQNVINGLEYTTLVIERFGETNAAGDCAGVEPSIVGQARACLSPAR